MSEVISPVNEGTRICDKDTPIESGNIETRSVKRYKVTVYRSTDELYRRIFRLTEEFGLYRF